MTLCRESTIAVAPPTVVATAFARANRSPRRVFPSAASEK